MEVRSWKVPMGLVLRLTSRKRRSMAFVVLNLPAFGECLVSAACEEEPFPRRGALAGRQAEVDDLLLAVGVDAQRHQDGTPQRAGAGLAGQHHAVEHERLVAVGELSDPLI